MIIELTEEQRKMIPVYVEKWAKVGLSTEPIKDYEETINLFYEKVLNKKRPAKIILAPSPLQAWEQLCEQVEKQVSKQVLVRLRVQVGKQVFKGEYRNYPFYDRCEVGFLAFYDYLNEILDIKYPENGSIYKRVVELGLIYMLDDICIVLDKPEQILMKNGVLHNDSGMAIKYSDGWGVYYLNGVKVTKEIVETTADKLDPKIILKETNVAVKLEIIRKVEADKLSSEILLKELDAEVRLEIVRRIEADKLEPEIILKERNAEIRREIVRKIGIERLEKKIKPNVLDKWGDYELHDYSNHFKRMRFRPVYLKMKNPSIGVWHYEGVNINEMEAPTCQAALKWRLKGKDFKPIRIT